MSQLFMLNGREIELDGETAYYTDNGQELDENDWDRLNEEYQEEIDAIKHSFKMMGVYDSSKGD